MPRVPIPDGLLSRTVNNAVTKGGHLIHAVLPVNECMCLWRKGKDPSMRVKAGKATRPSEGLCGKEVDAILHFAACFCMGRSPCEQLRREKEQNRRVQRCNQP